MADPSEAAPLVKFTISGSESDLESGHSRQGSTDDALAGIPIPNGSDSLNAVFPEEQLSSSPLDMATSLPKFDSINGMAKMMETGKKKEEAFSR